MTASERAKLAQIRDRLAGARIMEMNSTVAALLEIIWAELNELARWPRPNGPSPSIVHRDEMDLMGEIRATDLFANLPKLRANVFQVPVSSEEDEAWESRDENRRSQDPF